MLSKNKREICFSCKQDGHVAFDCPNKPITIFCGDESKAAYIDKPVTRSKYDEMRNRSEMDAEFDMHYGFAIENFKKENRRNFHQGSTSKTAELTNDTSFDTKSISSTSSHHRSGAVDDIDEELGKEANADTKQSFTTKSHDHNLILSLERTLFAALNNAWLLAMGGAGLMSVGNNDPTPLIGGIVLVVMAIFVVTSALLIHGSRVYRIKTGRSFQYSQSLLWVAFIGVATLVTMIFTLYYGIVYPFLQRTAEVEVQNTDFTEGCSL